MAAASIQNADVPWIAFHISYRGTVTLVIQNVRLSPGKWYNYPIKEQDVDSPEGQKIFPAKQVIIAACERENSLSGAKGSFEIWTSNNASVHVVTVQFKCLHSDNDSNTLHITRFSPDFDVVNTPGSDPRDNYMTVIQKGVN